MVGDDVRECISRLLREFDIQLPPGQSPGADDHTRSTPFTESEWLAHAELKLVCIHLQLELLRSLGRCVGASDTTPPASSATVKEGLRVIDATLKSILETEASRLAATEASSYPLLLKLAQRYKLSPPETLLFELLFVRGASRSPAIRATLGLRQDDKDLAMDMCGMSLLDVEEFLDEKRSHIAEGIITGQDDYDGKTFRMVKEAVSVLLLRPMKTEQWLKLSKTELLNVVERSYDEEAADTNVKIAEESTEDKQELSAVSSLANSNKKRKLKRLSSANCDKKRKLEELSENNEAGKQLDELVLSIDPGRPKKAAKMEAEVPDSDAAAPLVVLERTLSGEAQAPEKALRGDLSEFGSSLEYLDESFQVLALMLRIAKARHKEDMKEALNDERSWYDNYRPKASSIRELQAKLRYANTRLQERLKLTEEAVKNGKAELPRLELLAKKLGLDDFEKGVVVMLTGASISPVVKSILDGENGDTGFRRSNESLHVQDILTVYYSAFKDQVLARTYFYKSGTLASRGLIKLRPPTYIPSKSDLMDQQVELDRRILDWIVGLDTEMNELVDGSYLYTPKIPMEHVVLPEEQKNSLLKTVDNFARFKQFRKEAGLDDIVSYGAGLLILLCGSSGTGKTMTVNAVAHHLGKRVLLVDFHALYSSSSSAARAENSADVRGLFRDADMNDAIIFFDECEAIFAQREHGGDKMLNALLTEMERYEGIVMLATNRPQDLDEAMHRRITCVSEFYPPDHVQRLAIWKLSCSKLPLKSDIDWGKISLRYELTGGFIKNAVVSALLLAISRDNVNPVISEADIVEGCRLQMRGSLQMKSFSQRPVPKAGMEDLVLSSSMREKLENIIAFEKARAVLQGEWGFQQERLGTACLFFGCHGSGKSAAAEAIGFELGRPTKVINCAQLLSRESGTKSNVLISTCFKDARLMDAVLVLEDFQVLAESEENTSGLNSVSAWSHVAIGLLLHELQSFPGICILIAGIAQGSMFVRLDHELVRRLRFVVEFKMPDQSVRASMWKKMLPAKAPLASDIDFDELGKRFEFTSGAISSATVRAAAKAALRGEGAFMIKHKDLVEAGEAEKAHLHDEAHEIMLKAFI